MTQDKGAKLFHLPIDWHFCAEATARNLGLTTPLHKLPAEHWQKVLIGVETKMRLRSAAFPDDWQSSLAYMVGRSDG